jgi:hypothetical protein
MRRVLAVALHPYMLFMLPWIVGLVLFSVTPENIFSPFRDQYAALLIRLAGVSFAGLLLGLTFAHMVFPPHDPGDMSLPRLKFGNAVLVVWGLISVVEVVYFRGIPIATHLLHIPGPKSSSFGLPKVHGLAQSLFYYCTMAFALKYIAWRRRRHLVILVLLALWAIALFNRGTMIAMASLIFFCVTSLYIAGLVTPARQVAVWVATALGGVALLSIFVAFGNLRGSANIGALLGIAEQGGTAWLWVYAYLVGSGVNLALSLQANTPVLLHSAFNVSTGFLVFFRHGGRPALLAGFFLCGMICGILTSQRLPRRLIPLRSVLVFGLMFMFFGEFLLNPAFLLLAVGCYLFGVIRRSPPPPAVTRTAPAS